MRGEDVKTFQWAVSRAGHDCGPIDGIYGSKSYKACKAFQTAQKIKVDGICGPVTWSHLNTASGSGYGSRLMEWGFSPMIGLKGLTYAVKQFQSALSLGVDGIVGPQTLLALGGEIIKPRIAEVEIKCQCNKYCDGYPCGRGMGQGVLILAERIFREVSKTYPGALFFVAGRATDPSGVGNQIAGGYRCYRWNRERGGAAGSKHKECIALDIWGMKDGVSNSTIRKALETVALNMHTKGGVGYNANYIVHIDTRGYKARWSY